MKYPIGSRVCHYNSRTPATVVGYDGSYRLRLDNGQEATADESILEWLPEVGDTCLIAMGAYYKTYPAQERQQYKDLQWITQEFIVQEVRGNSARILWRRVDRWVSLAVLRVLAKSDGKSLQPSTKSQKSST